MYTLKLFSIGYTREAHRHFVSKVAEDTFFNKYALHSEPINCARVFNPKAREFSIDISNIPEYEQASYLIAEHNGKFYYYYITDYNVINGITVVYKVDEDIYHTYFNNRGDYFNFSGRLLQSNTNSDIVYRPSGKPEYTIITEDFTKESEVSDSKYNYCGIAVLSLNKSGVITLTTEELDTPENAFNELKKILDVGKLAHGDPQEEETFKVINTYIIPSVFITKNTDDYWIISGKKLYRAIGKKILRNFSNINNNYSVYVGTYFKRVRIPKHSNDFISVWIEFIENPNPDLIIHLTGGQSLSIIDDFACTIGLSDFSQYLSTNKMTFALNAISSVIGVATSVASGNPLAAVSGTLQSLQTVNDIYKASKTPDSVYNSGGNFSATFRLYPTKYLYKSRGIGIFTYASEKQEQIDSYFGAFGGECSGKYQTIADIIAVDGDKSVYKASGFFYRFSYIESGSGGTIGGGAFMNKIADMFTNGIRIYYIQE